MHTHTHSHIISHTLTHTYSPISMYTHAHTYTHTHSIILATPRQEESSCARPERKIKAPGKAAPDVHGANSWAAPGPRGGWVWGGVTVSSLCPPSGSSEQWGTPLTVWAETQTCRRQIPQGWRRRMGSQDRTRKMPLSPRPPPTQTALWPRRSSGRGKDWGRGPVFCLRASWERWESPSTPTCFHFQQSA